MTASTLAVAKSKHLIFAERYVANGGNGAQAAIDAGATEKSAKVMACRWLKRDDVKAIVSARASQALIGAGLSTERWAAETACIAHFDPRELYDAAGNLIPIHLLPEHVARAISSIETITDKDGGVTHKVKSWDKNAALGNAGKHLGVFEQDNRQKASDIKVLIQLVG